MRKWWAGAMFSIKCCCFCVKTTVKEAYSFKLACLKKKKKKEKHFGCLATFWFGTFMMLFWASGHLVHHETLKDEQYMVVSLLFLRFWEIFCNIIYCVSALYPTYRVYQLYNYPLQLSWLGEWDSATGIETVVVISCWGSALVSFQLSTCVSW